MITKVKPCKYCNSTFHYPSQCFYKPQQPLKPCIHCNQTDHYPWQCFKNPDRKKQMQRKIRRGKQNLKWFKIRRLWHKENRRESYNCYYCGKFLLPDEVELDHFISRSRAPHLRYDLNNLVVSCHDCNTLKGSLSGDE